MVSRSLVRLCPLSVEANNIISEELGRDAKTSRIGEAHLSQPCCTAVQLALTDLLRSWAIYPAAVVGHSSGEIAAAYAAGMITFEAAVSISYHRGRLIPVLKSTFPGLEGRMMAVGAGAEELGPMIEGLEEREVRIACYNSPSSLTISGDEPALAELEKLCAEKEIFNRRLMVETAYHSHHMNLIAKEYRASLLNLDNPVNTSVKFHSSLLGRLTDGAELGSQYWVDNLTNPVRFSEALHGMMEPDGDYQTGVNMLVELGPHSALQGPIKQVLKAVSGAASKVPYASALIRKQSAVDTALDLAAVLFTKGAVLNFQAINFPKPTTQPPVLLTDLPRYPWNYSNKYWQESRMTEKHKHRKAPRSDILGVEAIYSHDEEPTWRNILRLDDLPWLQHHKIQSLTVFPMSAFIIMALEAAAQKAVRKEILVDTFEITDLSVSKPLVITADDIEVTTQLRSRPGYEFCDEFRISSWSRTKGWTEHCVGSISAKTKDCNPVDPQRRKQTFRNRLQSIMKASQTKCAEAPNGPEIYDRLSELGVVYGPTFQGIKDYQASGNASTGSILIRDIAKEMPNHHLASPLMHPSSLEAVIEMYWPILGAGDLDTIYLPSSVSKIVFSSRIFSLAKEPGTVLRSYCRGDFSLETPQTTAVSIFVTENDDSTEPLISLETLLVSPILDNGTTSDLAGPRELCFKTDWEPILSPLTDTDNGNGTMNGNSVPIFTVDDIMIVHDTSESQISMVALLASELEIQTGKRPEHGPLNALCAAGKIVIVLNELQLSVLSVVDSESFSALQRCLTSAGGALWLTRGASGQSTNPDRNMVTGLSRAIRSETAVKFSTLDLDDEVHLSEAMTVRAIMEVILAVFGPAPCKDGELEFIERNGCFFTPRIIIDEVMNEYVHNQTVPSAVEPTPFGGSGRRLTLSAPEHGMMDKLHFVDDEAGAEPLGAREVEVQVKAAAVNYRDIASLKIQSKEPLGLEASGIVTSVGLGVSSIKVGDRVAALTQGAYGTYTRTDVSNVIRIPEGLSYETAASMPLAYCTAYQGLMEQGLLLACETILVHEGASAVGQAFVALAQAIGADVYVTVGSGDEKALLMSECNVLEANIFYNGDTSFSQGIRQSTDGEGVDVIINMPSLPPELVQASWGCLKKFGRFIDVDRRDARSATGYTMLPVELNASLLSVDVCAMMDSRPQAVQRVIGSVDQLLRYGSIRPTARVSTFGMSDIESAFKQLQFSNPAGKIVIVPRADDIVVATPEKTTRTLLRPDATYILVGGTGGLGRSMARWMVRRGAQTIVLVSRNASVSGKVKELAEDMGALGAKIIVRKCNVVSRSDVDSLIASLQDLPPIRGIVHGTMVLRVSA